MLPAHVHWPSFTLHPSISQPNRAAHSSPSAALSPLSVLPPGLPLSSSSPSLPLQRRRHPPSSIIRPVSSHRHRTEGLADRHQHPSSLANSVLRPRHRFSFLFLVFLLFTKHFYFGSVAALLRQTSLACTTNGIDQSIDPSSAQPPAAPDTRLAFPISAAGFSLPHPRSNPSSTWTALWRSRSAPLDARARKRPDCVD